MSNLRGNKCCINTVGIAGSAIGVGTTHLTIMLANYLGSKEKVKTAVLEMDDSGDLERMQSGYNDGKDNSIFSRNNVDYYAHPNNRMLASIFQTGYEYILMDFGPEWDKQSFDWIRCNRKIVVGNCSEWKQDGFSDMLCSLEQWIGLDNCCFAAAFGIPMIRKKLEKKYNIKIYEIPFEENPMMLHKMNFPYLQNLLQLNVATDTMMNRKCRTSFPIIRKNKQRMFR